MDEDLKLEVLLRLMEERRASDIHLQVGSQPIFRIKGDIERLTEFPVLEEALLRKMIYGVLKEKEIKVFEESGNYDTARGFPGSGRFRLNVFLQRGTIALVARRISSTVPNFETLNLPPSIAKIADFPNGLVLVTGATGSGKSSTLAALINHINRLRKCHILCIEDPIEYLYQNELAIINQREVGIDVMSFRDALKYAVREDPDVILVGEIRDRDTIEFGLHGAETGHLVFGTLHSSNATQTISRVLNFFPQSEHPSIRRSLSLQLMAIVSQLLLPSCNETLHRVPACEVMFNNPIVKRLIMDGSDEKLPRAIKSGKGEGMQDFEQALYELVGKEFITEETAIEYAENPHSLQMKLRGIFLSDEGGIIT